MDNESKSVLGLILVGAAIGLGQLLNSKETLTVRIVAGRALSSGGIGLAAAACLAFLPDLSFYTQVGIAATIASLGTSVLEGLVKRIFGGA